MASRSSTASAATPITPLGPTAAAKCSGRILLTNDTTGTVSDSGKDAKLADITDGTSNTLIVGRTDGTSNTALDASNKEPAYAINASGAGDPIYLFEFPRTDEANCSTNATTGTVSDSGNDARSAGIKDGLSNTLMVGERIDGSAASNVVEDVAVKYTMFDGEGDGLLLGGNGADRLVGVDELGMHDLQIDGAVLDVGDLLVDLGADDASPAIAASTPSLTARRKT